MKKRILALALTAVLTMSMGMTAMAASSSTSSNSGSSSSSSAAPAPKTEAPSVDKAAPGAKISTDSVAVAVAGKTVTLTQYVAATEKEVVATIASTATAGATAAGEAVSAKMSTPATPMFKATIDALGGKAAINNCGTVKTKAAAKDAFGNTIASAGTIKGVTSGSLVMLMSVNADGTIEFVEGVVDPVTGEILGAFKGAPKTISVLVFIPGK